MAKIIPLTNLSPNSSYSISVRGKSADGLYTAWSQFNTFTTVGDNVAPNTPSAPTISTAGPQNVIVTHDLTKAAGGILDADVRYLEVYITNSQVGATETYAGNIPIGPLSTGSISQSFFYPVPSNPSSITAKARVIAVDSSGNKSAYSAYSGNSSAIAYFSSAYIADLTVSSLSADKITTGTLAANVAISVGSTSPIVIKSNSASPYGQMYLGTGTYNNANTPFYVDSTNKFSLGTGLTWDGSTLTVNGNGTFAGTVNASAGAFTGFVTAGGTSIGKNWSVTGSNGSMDGTYSGLYINSKNFWGIDSSSKAVFQIGDVNNYVLWDGRATIPQLNIKGNITATGGSFTGSMTAGNSFIGTGITINGQSGTWNGIVVDGTSSPNAYNFWAQQGTTTKFQVGDATNHLKWTGTAVEVQGNITGSTITGSTFNYLGTNFKASIGTDNVYGLSQWGNGFYLENTNLGVKLDISIDSSQASLPDNRAATMSINKAFAIIANITGANHPMSLSFDNDSGISIGNQTGLGSYSVVRILNPVPVGNTQRSVRNIVAATTLPSAEPDQDLVWKNGDIWAVYV